MRAFHSKSAYSKPLTQDTATTLTQIHIFASCASCFPQNAAEYHAYSEYMDDAIFKLPTPLLLSKVVDALDEIYRLMSESQAADVRGDTYEYPISNIIQSSLNGQFRTPRHIIRMMVELLDPKADDVIYETCHQVPSLWFCQCNRSF